MNSVDNLLTHSPARYGQQVSSDVDFAYERDRRSRLLQWDDDVECVIKVDAVGEQIVRAVKHGSAELVGRVVLAAIGANLDRLSARDAEMDPEDFPEPEEAAAAAIQQFEEERKAWEEFAVLRAEYAKSKASADANEGRKGS